MSEVKCPDCRGEGKLGYQYAEFGTLSDYKRVPWSRRNEAIPQDEPLRCNFCRGSGYVEPSKIRERAPKTVANPQAHGEILALIGIALVVAGLFVVMKETQIPRWAGVGGIVAGIGLVVANWRGLLRVALIAIVVTVVIIVYRKYV